MLWEQFGIRMTILPGGEGVLQGVGKPLTVALGTSPTCEFWSISENKALAPHRIKAKKKPIHGWLLFSREQPKWWFSESTQKGVHMRLCIHVTSS